MRRSGNECGNVGKVHPVGFVRHGDERGDEVSNLDSVFETFLTRFPPSLSLLWKLGDSSCNYWF